MKNHWRKLLGALPLSVQRPFYKRFFESEHQKWQQNGRSLPPSHLSKQERIRSVADTYHLNTLVETGTYLGDMVFAMQPHFEQVYSIELSPLFFEKARKRFAAAGNVRLVQGDSSQKLNEIVPSLKTPALFWLDGHYSGGLTAKGEKECPVYEELETIFSSPLPHVILIDDARLFIGQNDYPTHEDLRNFVAAKRPGATYSVENDSILIVPAK